MSVISGVFQGLAQRAVNEPGVSELLSKALAKDPTANLGAVRKIEAAQLTNQEGSEYLLEGLHRDAMVLSHAFYKLNAPIILRTRFQPAAQDCPAQMSLSLQAQGRSLFDFKAGTTQAGYYLETNSNLGGGGMMLSMSLATSVADIDAAEEKLIKGLNDALHVSPQDAAYVLKALTHSL